VKNYIDISKLLKEQLIYYVEPLFAVMRTLRK